MHFKEYRKTQHYIDRKGERVDKILDVELPSNFYKPEDKQSETKSILIGEIQKRINNNLYNYIGGADSDMSKWYSTVIGRINVKRDNKIFPINIKAQVTTTTKKGETITKENEGNLYIALTHHNSLISLLLYEHFLDSPALIKRKSFDHIKREHDSEIKESDIEVRDANSTYITIDYDKLIKQHDAPRELTPQDLNYEVKKDYIKSSPGRPNFLNHNEYGRGEILSSEKGGAGRWFNVRIMFKDKKLLKTFPVLYSNDYFTIKKEGFKRFKTRILVEKIIRESTF